jgi:hypothetical protein
MVYSMQRSLIIGMDYKLSVSKRCLQLLRQEFCVAMPLMSLLNEVLLFPRMLNRESSTINSGAGHWSAGDCNGDRICPAGNHFPHESANCSRKRHPIRIPTLISDSSGITLPTSSSSQQNTTANSLSRSDKIALGVGLGIRIPTLLIALIGLILKLNKKAQGHSSESASI